MTLSPFDRFGGSVAAFLAERTPLDASLPLHVRIGSLYARVKRGDRDDATKKLLTDPATPELLRLHAAILLVAAGDFTAVKYLLQAHGKPAEATAVEHALRNCSRFPLAPLAAISLVPPLDVNELSVPDEEVRVAPDPGALIINLSHRPMIPGRALGVGVVIQRPLHFDNGFRHTGFLIVNATPPRVVPFDMGDILNREAADSVDTGSLVFVAHSTKKDQEALLVYVQGNRMKQTELADLYASTALAAQGIEIGVIAATGLGKDRTGYHVITAGGSHLYGHDARVELGSLCVHHPMNGLRPFLLIRARASVSAAVRKKVLASFRASTTLDYGIRTRRFTPADGAERQEVLTKAGEVITTRGPGNPRQPVYVELGTDGKTHFFTFPDDQMDWTETTEVVAAWMVQRDDAWGVSLPIPSSGTKARGLAVRVKDGYLHDRNFEPGTLLRFVAGDDGRTFVQELEFRLAPSCTRCFGVGYASCDSCGAVVWVTCPVCRGLRYIECVDCSGDGEKTCGKCEGSKRHWRACPECKGLPKLFVGGLSWDTDDYDLENAFEEFGEIVEAVVVSDQENGRSRGFGFVTFANASDAGSAIEGMNETKLDGRIITVNKAECKRCQGTKGKWLPCGHCRGTGRSNCNTCHGSGKVACGCRTGRTKCEICAGQRIVQCNCDKKPLIISRWERG